MRYQLAVVSGPAPYTTINHHIWTGTFILTTDWLTQLPASDQL